MATIGWIALGTLCTKVLAVSTSMTDVLDYTTVAITACASSAALIAMAQCRRLVEAARNDPIIWDEAATFRAMAAQTPFAESRDRLLALAQCLEKRRKAD